MKGMSRASDAPASRQSGLKLLLEVLTIQANFLTRTTAGERSEDLPHAHSLKGDLYSHASLGPLVDRGHVHQNPSADGTIDSTERITAPWIVFGDLPGESA